MFAQMRDSQARTIALPYVDVTAVHRHILEVERLTILLESHIDYCARSGLATRLEEVSVAATVFISKAMPFLAGEGGADYQMMIADIQQSAQRLTNASLELYLLTKERKSELGSVLWRLRRTVSSLVQEMRLTAIY
jgi:hypothetical protein